MEYVVGSRSELGTEVKLWNGLRSSEIPVAPCISAAPVNCHASATAKAESFDESAAGEGGRSRVCVVLRWPCMHACMHGKWMWMWVF